MGDEPDTISTGCAPPLRPGSMNFPLDSGFAILANFSSFQQEACTVAVSGNVHSAGPLFPFFSDFSISTFSRRRSRWVTFLFSPFPPLGRLRGPSLWRPPPPPPHTHRGKKFTPPPWAIPPRLSVALKTGSNL